MLINFQNGTNQYSRRMVLGIRKIVVQGFCFKSSSVNLFVTYISFQRFLGQNLSESFLLLFIYYCGLFIRSFAPINGSHPSCICFVKLIIDDRKLEEQRGRRIFEIHQRRPYSHC